MILNVWCHTGELKCLQKKINYCSFSLAPTLDVNMSFSVIELQ